MMPDTVLLDGNIHLVDEDFRTVAALAVYGDRVGFVGGTDEARRRAGPDTRVVDLQGRTVLPGFIDTHLHGVYAGKNLQVAVQLLDSGSIGEVLDRIRQAGAHLSQGEWLRGSNHWTIDALAEGRLPYRWELDQAVSDNPFWVNVAFHRGAANSRALEAAGISRDTPESFGHGTGWVVKDKQTGEPNGHLLESAMFAMMELQGVEPEETIRSGIRQVEGLFARNGITSVVDQGDVGPPFNNFRIMQDLWRNNELTIRWRMNHIGFEMANMPIERIDEHISTLRTISGFGDNMLKFGAIGELVLDGFVEDHWSRTPYAEDAFGEGWCGLRLFRPETVMEICRAAAAHGLQMNIHCSGDGALDAALEAMAATDKESPIAGLRWTLEHGGLSPTAQNIDDCLRLGLVVSTQQPLQYWHAKDIIGYFGQEARNYFPNRTWFDNGVPLRAGSDFDTAPLSPLLGISCITSRQTITGDTLNIDQALPREEAVKMYTRNAAWSLFEDGIKGSLEPGKLADLVVLSDDIMAVPDDRIADIEVLATLVGGHTVHDSVPLFGKGEQ